MVVHTENCSLVSFENSVIFANETTSVTQSSCC